MPFWIFQIFSLRNIKYIFALEVQDLFFLKMHGFMGFNHIKKLSFTQFKGTPADWMRFWGQFTAEIDAADISQITKFSYLKELLEPQVRPSIDGLPLTTEGYK